MKFECYNGHTFERVNEDTKKAELLNDSYRYSNEDDRRLEDVYGRYSTAKKQAFNHCIDVYVDMDGEGGHITGHNSNFFSYAFECENPKTGVIELVYITPTHHYITELNY